VLYREREPVEELVAEAHKRKRPGYWRRRR
jgi:hypothetical protein